ncbi:hypothetical protein CcNV_047 [Crangon crangon nudivirus]|uniref:Uncharacterized protein n=1 Tax=Crangon crangon nudivirus TaxID=2880838 RepID=A0AAE8Y0L4_9VIRU|nr:hypothetical protein QKT25_gp047 [Crangon crangon nudivirus]UBZ25531.1 hypothetical protein CcNV_047 [Crangon crangon nudivirus]
MANVATKNQMDLIEMYNITIETDDLDYVPEDDLEYIKEKYMARSKTYKNVDSLLPDFHLAVRYHTGVCIDRSFLYTISQGLEGRAFRYTLLENFLSKQYSHLHEEFLKDPVGNLRAGVGILYGIMWRNTQQDLILQMERCMAQIDGYNTIFIQGAPETGNRLLAKLITDYTVGTYSGPVKGMMLDPELQMRVIHITSPLPHCLYTKGDATGKSRVPSMIVTCNDNPFKDWNESDIAAAKENSVMMHLTIPLSEDVAMSSPYTKISTTPEIVLTPLHYIAALTLNGKTMHDTTQFDRLADIFQKMIKDSILDQSNLYLDELLTLDKIRDLTFTTDA